MAARHGLLLFVYVIGGPNLADLPTVEIVRQLLRATKTPQRLVVDQIDAVAATPRGIAKWRRKAAAT